MVGLNIFVACLRKEFQMRLTDLTHVVALILMPLILLLLLTHALEGAFVPALGTNLSIPVAGADVLSALEGRPLNTEQMDPDELRDSVRDGRSFLGLIGEEDGVRIVADPAFPAAALALFDRLDGAGIGRIDVEDSRGRPLELDVDFDPFNYTVPGLTVMFLFFLAAFTGFSIYGDVLTGAWLRIQASQVSSIVIISSKVLASVAVGLLQLTIVFGLGRFLLGLEFEAHHLPGMFIIGAAVALAATTFGVMLTGLTRTAQQMNQLNNLSVLVLAGLGGAIAPIAGLPEVLQRLSIFTPHYWALNGFRDIMFRDFGINSVPGNVWPILLMAVIFLAVGLLTLRYSRLSRAIY